MSLIARLARKALLATPSVWERCGLHVIPDHFYDSVRSPRSLPTTFFERESACPGLEWSLETQYRHLREIFPGYAAELEPDHGLGMLACVDAAIYYAMIRHYRPGRLIEIGSGESTYYAALACARNHPEHPGQLVCIEPFPTEQLRGLPGVSRLITTDVQDVDLGEFADSDLLFIDSSHIVKTASDVVWEILEILPRLKVGCLVHWHDIFLPGEYPETGIKRDRLFWNEQYAVQAFLTFNRSFEIVWASQFMHRRDPQAIGEAFGRHAEHDYPLSSLWVRRVS